jgi:hypothetical protein
VLVEMGEIDRPAGPNSGAIRHIRWRQTFKW